MSSPVITRLGLNQFWYKYWYSDTFFSKLLNQDRLIETFVTWYLSYGLQFFRNPLISNYWYDVDNKSVVSNFFSFNMRYLRRYFYSNDVVGVEHSYFLRNHSGEYFPFRLWLFRFCGWLILSVSWFKPRKKKLKQTFKNDKNYSQVSSFSFFNHKTKGNLFLRSKILFYFLVKVISKTQPNYNF